MLNLTCSVSFISVTEVRLGLFKKHKIKMIFSYVKIRRFKKASVNLHAYFWSVGGTRKHKPA